MFFKENLLLMLMGFANITFACLIPPLFVYHIFLMVTNRTTNEKDKINKL